MFCVFLDVPRVGLQCMTVAFPGHTHLHFHMFDIFISLVECDCHLGNIPATKVKTDYLDRVKTH